MKIRYIIAAMFAAAALVSCRADENEGSGGNTPPVQLSEPEETSAENADTSDAPEATEAVQPTAAARIEFEEEWMNMYQDVLINKAYESVMCDKGSYALIERFNNDEVPELFVYNEDGTKFAAYSYDHNGEAYCAFLFDYGSNVNGSSYSFIPGGYTIGYVVPSNRSFDEFRIHCFSSGDEHFHGPESHSGLCLYDRTEKYSEYYFEVLHPDKAPYGTLSKDYDVTFHDSGEEEIVLGSSWVTLNAENDRAVKLEDGRESEICRTLFDKFIKTVQ